MDVSDLYLTQSTDSNDNSLIDPKRGALLLVMTVEIAEDTYGQIIVYEKDRPETLATAFCKLHDLGNDVAVVLREHIVSNIQSQPAPQFTLPEPATL